MDTQTFINQVAAGDASGAKDLLNDLLAAKAFEALDAKKIEMAQSLFTGKEESSEPEVQDTEETVGEQ
jgi:hypothetical protein